MKTPYEVKLESKTTRSKDLYTFSSADGVSSKQSFRDAELAIADHINLEKDDELLTYDSGFGFLPTVLAHQCPDAVTIAATRSDRSHQLTELNFEKNSVEKAQSQKVAFCDEIERNFDKIAFAPESYDSVKEVKNRISNMLSLLKDDGQLIIAGSKTDGIKRYRDHLKSTGGNIEKLAQVGSQRVYRFEKDSELEEVSVDAETGFTTEIEGRQMEFSAFEGLFSPRSLDDATRLLIENVAPSQEEKVLDLACGYGAVGIFLKAIYDPKIYLSDDNRLASLYTEKNLEKNGISDYLLKNRDCLDGFQAQNFDLIVSNPPTHQGKGVTEEMFEEAYRSLRDGGRLIIVFNQNMNFEKTLKERFDRIRTMTQEKNYKILEAVR